MAFDYAALRDSVVKPLIEQFGKTDAAENYLIVPGMITGPEYDPQRGPDTTWPVKVVQTVFKKADNSGTLVEANDALFLVSTEILKTVEMAEVVAVQDRFDDPIEDRAGDVVTIRATGATTSVVVEGPDPTMPDRIVVDSTEYQIVRIDPLKPGPVVMLWKIHARR